MHEITTSEIAHIPKRILDCIMRMRKRKHTLKRFLISIFPTLAVIVLFQVMIMCLIYAGKGLFNSSYLPIVFIFVLALLYCFRQLNRQFIIASGEYSAVEFSSCRVYTYDRGIDSLMSLLPVDAYKVVYYPDVKEFVKITQDLLFEIIQQHIDEVAKNEHMIYVVEYSSIIDQSVTYHIIDPDLVTKLAVDYDNDMKAYVLLRLCEDSDEN